MADKANTEITVIGQGTTIKGEMQFEGSARILGGFEGKIVAGGDLEIGQTAECKADLEADRVIIDGSIRGNIKARQQLTLTAHARVTGDLVAGTLVVTDGASFVGHCSVGPEAQKLSSNKPAASTTSTTSTNSADIAARLSRPATAEPKPSRDLNADSLTPPWRDAASSGSNGSSGSSGANGVERTAVAD
jgi:cytoskeletal protein CcmA (bactofilin family)